MKALQFDTTRNRTFMLDQNTAEIAEIGLDPESEFVFEVREITTAMREKAEKACSHRGAVLGQLFTKMTPEMFKLVVIGWDGLADKADEPLEFTPANVELIVSGMPELAGAVVAAANRLSERVKRADEDELGNSRTGGGGV